MNFGEVMARLEACGKPQTRKIYARHGVGEPMFGVSYADLKGLRSKIKVDHDLATRLWESGNHDARVLATMVADPQRATARLLDAWSRDLDNYVITGALADLAAAAPSAVARYRKWIKSRGERISAAGWSVFARLCERGDLVADSECFAALRAIEERIHLSPNRTRHSMNQALIAIGIRGGRLEKAAIEAARRIGKVDVDHGQTGCRTPDAEQYIRKTLAHRRKKARR